MKLKMGMLESGITVIGEEIDDYLVRCIAVIPKNNEIFITNVFHEAFMETISGKDYTADILKDRFLYIADIEELGNSVTISDNYKEYFIQNPVEKLPIISDKEICVGITSATLYMIGKYNREKNVLEDSILSVINKDQNGHNTVTLFPVMHPAFGIKMFENKIKAIDINLTGLIAIIPIKDLALSDQYIRTYMKSTSGLII